MKKIFLLTIFLIFFGLAVFAVEDSRAEEDCIKFAYICAGPPLNLIVGENCWSSGLSAEAKVSIAQWEKTEVGDDCEPLDADNDNVPDSEVVPCDTCDESEKMGCCYGFFDDGTPRFLGFTTQDDCTGVSIWDPKCANGTGSQTSTGCCVCEVENSDCIDKGGSQNFYYYTMSQASYEACVASCTSAYNGQVFAFDTDDPTCVKSRQTYDICGDCKLDKGEDCDPPTSLCDFNVPCNAACKCAFTDPVCKKYSVCKDNGQICNFDSVKCEIIEDSCHVCERGTVCKESTDATTGWVSAQCIAPDIKAATGPSAKPLGWASAPLGIINTAGIETLVVGTIFVVAVIAGIILLKKRRTA
ncbi:MAG: hypothetical protein V1672_01895 [Candidatus Diapherotrites archaeon]